MIRKVIFTLAAACALAAAAFADRASAQPVDDTLRARVIVKYKADSPILAKGAAASASATVRHAAQAQALGARIGIALATGAGLSERAHVVTARGITSEQLAKRLAAESDVEYAVPDRRVHIVAAPNDPLYAAGPAVSGTSGGPAVGQWYLHAPAGDVQSSINAEPAWDALTGGTTVVVGMIDTGVRFDHPDLLRAAAGGHLLPGYDMIADPATANDGDGRDADPSDPGDSVTDAEISQQGGPYYQCVPQAEASSWHGTQTSGLVAALANNGIGMAGAARNVLLLPVRVLGKCGGYDSDVIAGMLWATGLSVPGVPANPTPARVLNLSLGGDGGCTSAYVDAVGRINAAGTVVVVAAGNDAGHALGAPASCPGVIAVTALRHVGTKVGFSDLGPNVAISAPGGNCVNIAAGSPCLYPILTTSNAGTSTPVADASGGSIYTDSFNASLGTSFAAPLVAATTAMMLSAQPTMTPSQVRALLQATARPFPTTGGTITSGSPAPQCAAPQPIDAAQVDQLECYCTTSTCGAGMLDAGAAVRAAAGVSTNYTGLFWQSPAGIAPGWGINFAHAGDQIFATWYTYDGSGKAWWLSMLASRPGPTGNVFVGPDLRRRRAAVQRVQRLGDADIDRIRPADDDRRRQWHVRIHGERDCPDQAADALRRGNGSAPRLHLHGSDARFRDGHQLSGTLVGRRRHRSRMGHQFRAPGQRDLRDVVHLRREQRAAVAVGAGDVERRGLQRNALSHRRADLQQLRQQPVGGDRRRRGDDRLHRRQPRDVRLQHQRAGRPAARHAEQADQPLRVRGERRNDLQVGAAARGRRVVTRAVRRDH